MSEIAARLRAERRDYISKHGLPAGDRADKYGKADMIGDGSW